MALKLKPESSPAYVETVEEITKIFKSLLPRPSIEEVEAAISIIQTVNDEEEQRLEEICNMVPNQDVPQELFSLLIEARKVKVKCESYEQRREAMQLVELDKVFGTLDGLILRASELVSGDTKKGEEVEICDVNSVVDAKEGKSDGVVKILKDESEILKEDGLKGLIKSSAKASTSFTISEKLSLMKVAAMIENFAKTQEEVLNLQGKLMDKVEWIPVSIGKLSNIVELNLSRNRIMALPLTIGSLKSLKKLDVHSNQLINLPDCFTELINLTDVDLHANNLKSLPASFGNLINLMNLDLSLNRFVHLPDVIGSLCSLKRLNAETNELEDVPYAIGSCVLLEELRLDFNNLRGLPEALGKLHSLEILTLHYNRIRRLPTTIGNLLRLRELDASFNELESIPEGLCYAVSLRKLNVGKNFADLRALPELIGNLKMLEELDISDDQIKTLPDSFMFLSNLAVFRADETPLEIPPRQMVKLGAQDVVQYMAEHVAKRKVEYQIPEKKRGLCFLICHCFGKDPVDSSG
ncbi:scaffold/adaptor protein [Lithospermum erythrorhizon]|uniref:Scaffold/adaptor protein n=1 Tax=Lithospermum erythrorhizon TaxID=34254 RepID=A0AAV3P2D0_LITER